MTKEAVREELKLVMDPELGVNVVDLGLIYDIQVDESAEKPKVDIDMTLTSFGCPLGGFLEDQVKEVTKGLGAGEVNVNITFEPPWNPDMVSDEVKEMLGLL